MKEGRKQGRTGREERRGRKGDDQLVVRTEQLLLKLKAFTVRVHALITSGSKALRRGGIYEGVGADSPLGSRGKAPGQRVWGTKPPETEDIFLFQRLIRLLNKVITEIGKILTTIFFSRRRRATVNYCRNGWEGPDWPPGSATGSYKYTRI